MHTLLPTQLLRSVGVCFLKVGSAANYVNKTEGAGEKVEFRFSSSSVVFCAKFSVPVTTAVYAMLFS